MDYINSLLPIISHFHSIGYWIAFFSVLIETVIGIGFIFPGSSIIIFLGALSAQGYLDVGDLLVFAIVGAILGDNINYYLGDKYGFKWVRNGVWFLKPEYFEKGKQFFKNHGARSVFIGRFVPGMKEILPFIAGVMKMSKIKFFLWNFLGAIGWGFEFVGAGYLFSQSLNLAKMWLSRASFLLVVLLLIFIIFYFIKLVVAKKGKDFFFFVLSVWNSITQAIIKNIEVQKFKKKHSSFFAFLKRRLNKTNFFGLPLTTLFLSFLYILFLFVGLVEDFVNSDLIVSIDIRIENLLFHFHNVFLTNFFLWITLLGKWQIVSIFLFATVILLWVWKRNLYIAPMILSVFGSESFTYLGKLFFHRARPLVAMYKEATFSFPSGHATIAMAFYGYLIFVLLDSFPKWKTKINIFFVGILTILLLGFSRLYLGVHYLSDVLAGYLIGLLWLIIAISILKWMKSRDKSEEQNKKYFKQYLTSVLVVVVAVIFYIGFATQYNSHFILKDTQQKEIIKNTESIFSNKQLKYTETIFGVVQKPLSFIILAKSDQQLINSFKKSGWRLADNIGVHSGIKMLKSLIFGEEYKTAPMTLSFWNYKVNEFGFEKPVDLKGSRKYHYARFWKTNYIDEKGNIIYVGTASFESRAKWGFVHLASLNLDAERKFLFNHLKEAGTLDNFSKEPLTHLVIGETFLGDTFFTDGEAYFLKLK